MSLSNIQQTSKRYKIVSEEKAGGATYTPQILSNFVAKKIVLAAGCLAAKTALRVLDPAVGDGELLISLLEQLNKQKDLKIEVYGFETDLMALNVARARLKHQFQHIGLHFETGNFLEFVLKNFGEGRQYNLFQPERPEGYDLIIANPPYVRTQIMGAAQSQLLAQQFGLTGRVDLYYPFILGIAQVLKPQGIAGIIVSNRFMTTKSGASVRRAIRERFNIRHVWDLGDTKIFNAAVLPAVLLVEGKNVREMEKPAFTSIYQTSNIGDRYAANAIEALSNEGIIKIDDGRRFRVHHGKLDTSGAFDGVWRIATAEGDAWLSTVEAHTWGTFRTIGKIRVGVKTCADKVFIRSDWQNMPDDERPELLRSLTTHHIANRFKPLKPTKLRQILYPYVAIHGKRYIVDLSKYPCDRAYLECNRADLYGRKYVIEAGREWYEIWVPQDPAAWDQPKLVFRDIAKQPTFWIDKDRSVVNGDCYWLICQNIGETDLLWLAAAIGNSTFIEAFYDRCFHNKLYAGRRRFITQYVEKFPLPDPESDIGQDIIRMAKQIYNCMPLTEAEELQKEIDGKVWQAFGLVLKKISR